jgi:hypothetical protein
MDADEYGLHVEGSVVLPSVIVQEKIMAERGRYRKIERRHFVTTDPIASLRAGVRLATKAGVPFALIGRLAVWFYVPPEGQQLTKDADLAVPHGRLEPLVALAREKGYKVHALGIGGYGLSAPGVVVDYIDRHPELADLYADAVAAARARRLRAKVGNMAIPVVPIPYLIAMKLVSHEPKDERDVQELLPFVSANDYADVRKLVRRYLGYGSTTYLDFIARSIGHPGPGMKSRYRS